MSTPQRTRASITLAVDRYTADVVRLEAKKILMFGHEDFEDFLELDPDAQYTLAIGFREVIDLITTVGWDPRSPQAKATSHTIALTEHLAKQLAHRRIDLGASITERLSDYDQDEPLPDDVLTEITADRNATGALDHLIGAYTVAVAQQQP